MLLQISIQNFVLIDKAILNFEDGLTVISGETGAGKSILLGALGITLGQKVSGDLIQPGKDFLRVSTTFDLSERPKVVQFLEANGIKTDDGLLVIRREVKRDGKSRCFVNDEVQKISTLKTVVSALIDIHSQHDNQYLFQETKHQLFFDRFSQLQDKVKAYQEQFSALGKAYQQKKEIVDSKEKAESEKEFLKFTIKEIGDIPSDEKYRKLKDQLQQTVQEREKQNFLYGLDEGLNQTQQSVEAMLQKSKATKLPGLGSLEGKLLDVKELLSDVQRDLGKEMHSSATGDEQIDDIQEKLSRSERLMKKYGLDLNSLNQRRLESEDKLRFLEQAGFELEKIDKAITELERICADEAVALHMERKKSLPHFESQIQAELKSLNMENARLTAAFEVLEDAQEGVLIKEKKARLNHYGLDKIEFAYEPQPKAGFKSLKQIASGGEISRIMLALKKVLLEQLPINTLIFDEIDTGIGGETALKLGQKLKEIAEKRQLIVITHLPQIAKYASHHFQVKKQGDKEGLKTDIINLSEDERVAEIARMLSGDNQTTESLQFARDFLKPQ